MSALRLTAAIKQRMLNYLQRLILILPFDASHADSFTSCMTPVETSTGPNIAVAVSSLPHPKEEVKYRFWIFSFILFYENI